MRREASIILPRADNDGRSLLPVKLRTIGALATAFGGVTAHEAEGAWVNGRGKLVAEPVWRFDVAYEPSATNDDALRAVAFQVGELGRQEAVYLKYASGEVDILETSDQRAVA